MIRGTSQRILSKRSAHGHSVQGFGLLEFLIAICISVIVIVETASMFQFMNSSANNLAGEVGSSRLRSYLMQTFSNPVTCMKSLQSTTFDAQKAASSAGMPVNFQIDSGATNVVGPEAGGTPVPLLKYNVSVASFVFQNPVTSVDPTTPANTLYTGTLSLNLLKMANTTQVVSGGRGLLGYVVGSMSFSVNPAGTVTNCFYQAVNPIAACTSFGGKWVPGNKIPCQISPPCPQGEILMGYKADLTPNCKNPTVLADTVCGTGQTVVSTGRGYDCE